MRDMGWVPPWADRIQGGAAGAAHNAARLIPIRSKRYEGSKGERIDKMNPIQGALGQAAGSKMHEALGASAALPNVPTGVRARPGCDLNSGRGRSGKFLAHKSKTGVPSPY
jgi:hypothetical protein